MITAPISTTNITGLRTLHARVELDEAAHERLPQDAAAEEALSRGRVTHEASSIEREVELEHVHAGLAEHAEARPSVFSSISSRTRSSGSPRTSATRRAWIRALASEMCGSTPEADVVTASTGTSARSSPGL